MPTTTSITTIVQLEVDDERSWWDTERDGIRAALVDHYGGDVAGEALTPPRDPAGLRARLREVAPRLAALTDRIRWAFDHDEASGVIIPELGLGEAELDDKRKGAFALAVLLGDPTANIPFDTCCGTSATAPTSRRATSASRRTTAKRVTIPTTGRYPSRSGSSSSTPYAPPSAEAECPSSATAASSRSSSRRPWRVGRRFRLLTETKLPRRIPEAFTNGILIINNHIALHGRTAFSDPERHLLRVRLHEPSA